MEQRQIKFRGKVPASDKIYGGQVVFGSLVDYGEDVGYRFWINPIKGERNYPVEPESIAQLCGYDDDGKEVYEGDTVIDGGGTEYTVRFYAMGVNDEDCVSLDYDGKLCFKLKEEF